MTATEKLRRLLDERGVEYRWDNGTATWHVDGVMYNAWGYDNERLTMSVCHLTPEQAVEATLGRGTCHLIDTKFPTGDDSDFKACSGCGFWIHNRLGWEKTRFCPHCGRKVVYE